MAINPKEISAMATDWEDNLAECVEPIKHSLETARERGRLALTDYKEVGFLLDDAHTCIPHGNTKKTGKDAVFGSWVKTNFGFGARQAHNYILIYKRWSDVEAANVDSMRAALDAIKKIDKAAGATKPRQPRQSKATIDDELDVKQMASTIEQMEELLENLAVDIRGKLSVADQKRVRACKTELELDTVAANLNVGSITLAYIYGLDFAPTGIAKAAATRHLDED
jgi:hypothetical protein